MEDHLDRAALRAIEDQLRLEDPRLARRFHRWGPRRPSARRSPHGR